MSDSTTKALNHITCAWVTPVLGVAGNLLYYKPLLLEFSKLFREFRILTCEFKADPSSVDLDITICGKFIRLYKDERYKQTNKSGYTGGFSLSSPKVISELLKYKPDLIIINELSIYSLYAIVASFFIRNCSVLCIVECAPRHGGGTIVATLRKLLRKLIARHSDYFLTNNSLGKDYLTKSLDIPSNKVLAKPYLVSNTHSWKSNNTHTNTKQHLKCLFVGQIIKRKGLHLALESISRLPRRYLNRITFNIVGDGPYKPKLENICKEKNIHQHVIFHGKVDYEDLSIFYSEADIYIFPTLGDYRALSPFEALSSGVAIVASIHDGGIYETVENGRNGYSFDPYNIDELTSILIKLIDSPENVDKFKRKSKTMAEAYTLSEAVSTLSAASTKAISSS